MWKSIATASLLGMTLAFTSPVFGSPSIEDQIKARQSVYTFIAWNMNRIRAQVVDQEQPYQAEQVQAAARAIAAAANSGLSAMYGPGSAEGSGWKPTRLKAEFFDELADVGPIAMRFMQEAARLAEVAETGDQAAIAAQFRTTASTCGDCHRRWRAAE